MRWNKHVLICGMRANKHPFCHRYGSKSRLPATQIYIYKCWRWGIFEVEVTVVLWWKMWKYVRNKSKTKTWTFISIFNRFQTRWFEWVTDVPMPSSNKSIQPKLGVNNTLIHDFGLVYPDSSWLDVSFRSTHLLLASSGSYMLWILAVGTLSRYHTGAGKTENIPHFHCFFRPCYWIVTNKLWRFHQIYIKCFTMSYQKLLWEFINVVTEVLNMAYLVQAA